MEKWDFGVTSFTNFWIVKIYFIVKNEKRKNIIKYKKNLKKLVTRKVSRSSFPALTNNTCITVLHGYEASK